MKLAMVGGAAVAVTTDGYRTITAGGDGPSDILTILERSRAGGEIKFGEKVVGELEAPIPRPGQVFAIGLNYRHHASEMGLNLPTIPMVFTKFPSAVARPNTTIPVVAETVDWEAELVVVVGAGGRNISVSNARQAIAGYMVGQDVSERTLQMSTNPAQFGLGKSFESFAPTGPWLTTCDEIEDPQNLRIQCSLNGELQQNESTSDMVFSVFEIVSFLSSVCELRPGDLIFTGSPAGVGQGKKPPRFLRPGDELETSIEGLGTISNRCVEAPLWSFSRD